MDPGDDQGVDQEGLVEVLVVGIQVRNCLFGISFQKFNDGRWRLTGRARSVWQEGDLVSPLTAGCQQFLSSFFDGHGGRQSVPSRTSYVEELHVLPCACRYLLSADHDLDIL